MKVGMNRIALDPEERVALDVAHQIVAERAENEHGSFDDAQLEWWLLGFLREGKTIEEMLELARTAPFQPARQTRSGYAWGN